MLCKFYKFSSQVHLKRLVLLDERKINEIQIRETVFNWMKLLQPL